MIKSCYIHIPFCNTICSYCDFCKQFYHKKKVKDYLKKLKQEITRDYQNEILETIYIGGGTPTCLELDELEELLEIVDHLKKEKELEYTIEANIESLTKEKLICLKKHGMNRLSIGIETINPKYVEFLNRKSNQEEIREKISLARELGFSNINVDLIYAIPNETIEELKEDIEFILSLQVEHISTYSLMIEPHTELMIHQVEPIDEELDQEMYECICSLLKENHYEHYEISNFAKKGYESKHNMCYWHNEEYYGFGLGAASYINNVRSCHTRSLTNYPNKIVEQEILTEEDKIEYEVILNLRLKEGINLQHFKEIYQKELRECYQYEELVKEELLVEKDNHLMIPEKLWYVSNDILVKILQNKIDVC